MTIKELIEELQEHPEDLQVLLSSDSEGNSFRKLEIGGISHASASDIESFDIDVGIPKLTLELQQQGYTTDDVYDNQVIVLYP